MTQHHTDAPSRGRSAALPGWARAADVLTVLLALAALRVVVLGGIQIGTVFSMSTPWRALLAMVVVGGLRHYLVRNPPLHERAWTGWRGVAGVAGRAWLAYVRTTGMTGASTLRIFALATLAVAQPLFDLLAREPAFFVARNTTTSQLGALVAGVCVGLPLTCIGIEALARRFRAGAGHVVHGLLLAMLAGLLVLPFLKRWGALDTGPLLGAALLLGAGVAVGAQRTRVVGSFLTALSPAVIVVPAVFLANADVRNAVLRAEGAPVAVRVDNAPPIVFVVFDELPTNSLLDRDGRIDRRRYPHLARLVDGATWYRNASTVSAQTVWAVPALVSGRYPLQPNSVPTRRYYPDNLFTMLSGSYRMTVFGRFLQLCPADVCDYDADVHDSLTDLAADLGIAYLHIVAPPTIGNRLPPIAGDWRDSARARRFRSVEEGHRQRNERSSELDRFLETITSDRSGRLYFLHTLLPHMPYQYVPSGRRYQAPDYQRRREGGELLFLKSDPWLPVVLQQRHLLQLGMVDRFVGRLMERLRALGIYDDALIVLTADHGASFLHGTRRREVARDRSNAADILMVPLIVKLPHQVVGAISDRSAETTDVVPTIAEVLSTATPYAVDGRSLLNTSEPERLGRTFIQRGRRRVRVVEYPSRLEDWGWELKLQRFESGLYGLGPHGSLVGRDAAALDVRPGTGVTATLARPVDFQDVDVGADTLPLHVWGRLTGAATDPAVSLAVSVNGVIAATTMSYQENGRRVFASMIPEESLIPGANDVDIFIVDGSRHEPVLRPLLQ